MLGHEGEDVFLDNEPQFHQGLAQPHPQRALATQRFIELISFCDEPNSETSYTSRTMVRSLLTSPLEEEVNVGGEFLSDDKIWDIRRLADKHYRVNGKRAPLLNDDEVMNLSVRKGTLNDKERSIINNHVSLTQRMLAKLPFPRKFEKVPEIAAMHHEKLDCTGYPNGLCARDIPLQSRILAVADVFEALTAADRPYKSGKKLSEAVRILSFMVKDRHLDEDVCDLLIKSGLVQDYAREKIAENQRNEFEWKGKTYGVNEGKRPVT